MIVTPGGKPIMFFTILALAERGAEVIYPNPGFPVYESMIRFCGARAVPMRFLEEKGYHPDFEDLAAKITPKTRLIILNSPQNPAGSAFTAEEMEILAGLLKDHPQAYVLSDEIYKDILYEGVHQSIATLPQVRDRTIILDGFSKSYAMTGWRLGYGVFPEELVPHITRLAANSVSCAATFIQKAAIEALEGDQEPVIRMVEEFRRRRDAVVEGLRKIPRGFMPHARGRLLCVSVHQEHGHHQPRVPGAGPSRSGTGPSGRALLREVRRGLPAPLLRQLPGKPRASFETPGGFHRQ